jgi:P27 family predicted phage terminase small subunit
MVHRGRKNKYDLIEPAVLRPKFKPLVRQPPDHLGEPERQIWDHVFADYELTNETAIDVLVTALEAHQRSREAREAIQREGMQVAGRDGQSKPHPLLATERDARAAFLAGLKALGHEL